MNKLVSLLFVLLAVFVITGCTSDLPNSVGNEIPDGLDAGNPIRFVTDDIINNGNLVLTDPDIEKYGDNEILYFGHEGNEASSILVKYDFSELAIDNYDDIQSVKIRMQLLNWYKNHNTAVVDTSEGERDVTLYRHYAVHNLTNELTEDDVFPSEEPEHDLYPIFESPAEGTPGGSDVLLELNTTACLLWFENGSHNGLIIKENETPEDSDGFFAFAAKELTHFNEVSTLLPEAVYAPALVITFNEDAVLDPITLWPEIDTCTLHQLDPLPETREEGFTVRTHLRNYPWFSFNTEELPDDVLINRASLFVWSDTLSSYGPLTSLVVTEVPLEFVESLETVTLDSLQEDSGMYVLDGQLNIDPYTTDLFEFDVTSSIQRQVNGVYEDEMQFMILTGEDMFPNYDVTSIDPDFFLARFNFAGTDNQEHRPYLEITYTERNTGGE